MDKPKKYRFVPSIFTDSNQSIQSNCNAITFFNEGNGNIVINNAITIKPNRSLELACNENEVDVTDYEFYFVPGATDNNLLVIRKIEQQ